MTHIPASITRIILTTAACALLTACVSKGKYDELNEQNAKLQQLNTVLSVQQRELFAVTVILSKEVDLLDEEIMLLERERAELEIELETMLLDGNIKMELLKSGLSLTLDEEVLFDSGSVKIKPSGSKAIADVVAELEQVPYQIVVIGHTDNIPIGSQTVQKYPSNWALAAARASAVVKLMADEGIPRDRLVAVSLGDTHPIASNATAEGRSANRRIEIRLRPVMKKSSGL